MSIKDQKVLVITKEYNVEGIIKTREGYHGRFSDLVNDGKNFLNISDAIITRNDKTTQCVRFLCINKDAVILIYPKE